jgi:peptidoglycan-N-acetylglucosamine deacetylase
MIKNPIAWPNGARCACLTFDMDADSLIHLVHPLDGYRRESDLSMLQYGPQVAIPRNRYIPQART